MITINYLDILTIVVAVYLHGGRYICIAVQCEQCGVCVGRGGGWCMCMWDIISLPDYTPEIHGSDE